MDMEFFATSKSGFDIIINPPPPTNMGMCGSLTDLILDLHGLWVHIGFLTYFLSRPRIWMAAVEDFSRRSRTKFGC